ncbi:unnamed protein product [Medioppia subpectinata]|uniref:Uncharacterized protein n=1 Tax=Medioppia subpectinata TaxID=1979941 RepID=A0A7R9PZU5_9ACAR|nr:unnamed protein product [Medioppia subpectinata]CAG2106838.1 unnamed protein product [Medioppia subpectinata]
MLCQWRNHYWTKSPKWVLLPLATVDTIMTIVITIVIDFHIKEATEFNGISSQQFIDRVYVLHIVIGVIGSVSSCLGILVSFKSRDRCQYFLIQCYGILMSICGGTSITLAILSGMYIVFVLTALYFISSFCANYLARVMSQLFPITAQVQGLQNPAYESTNVLTDNVVFPVPTSSASSGA